ncbi:polysaccharide biosynthesis/export family protein [Brumimicrobium mesophilum]|uniref:polysaccharide biosynthesis/export family protein n=1 Tax=Brumimicrobium mesophilum TaxID=392717 RepID=UPI00131C04B0|nr:polysaccharide biosynthesis/export family protein [Brumimicrobium mesophilum]
MIYFQTSNQDSLAQDSVKQNMQFTPTLKPDDFLSVVITANDPESVIPFNYPESGGGRPLNQGYMTGNAAKSGYLIDPDGIVNLPVLGKIKLGGLSRTVATDILEKRYALYLKNPVVNIQIQNYKITVLGDVNRPGTYNIPNERITLLEAIGLSGDLDITGERENVLVIREENGKRAQYRINLKTDEVFSSPVYYLQQNDVVYIEPNTAKRTQGTVWRTSGGIFISLVALILTTYTIVFN